MGLDMYLYATVEEYVTNDYKSPMSTRLNCKYPNEFNYIHNIIDYPSVHRVTSYKVGYWRKANAIHKWFVDNIGKGIDDCKPLYVSLFDLKTLLAKCKEVLVEPSRAPEILPTEDGFFFGPTSYGDFYFKDIDKTIAILEPLIATIEQLQQDGKNYYEIQYEASW